MGRAPSFPVKPGEGEIDVGRYRITLVPELGNGSFGRVYKAVDKGTRKTVAVKAIRFQFDGQIVEEAQVTATAEAENMKQINHPNIVRLYDYQLSRGTTWLFMDYCNYGDLNRYLADNANMSLTKKLSLMRQMTSAVSHLHNRSPPIIHRDIKPGNVLVKRTNKGDAAMITDFGFAKIYDFELSKMGSAIYKYLHESMKGTPSYMAPEFFYNEESELKYTATVDIFSLGLLNAIILEYGPDNMKTHPVSVEMRAQKKSMNFGKEMSECYKKSDPFPHIVRHATSDDAAVYDLKDLILQMTQFHDKDRVHINAVESKLDLIIEALENAGKPMKTVNSKTEESSGARQKVGKSDKTAQMAPITSGTTKKVGKPDKAAQIAPITSDILDNHSLSKITPSNINKKKQVQLSAPTCSLMRVGKELWSCQDDGVTVFSSKLKKQRTFLSQAGSVSSAALLPDNNVIVCDDGLRVVTTLGVEVKRVSDSVYWDVAVSGTRVLATDYRSPAVHVYDSDTWQQVHAFEPPCTNKPHKLTSGNTRYAHTIIVTNKHSHVCCPNTDQLFIFDSHHKLVSTVGPDIHITQCPSTAAHPDTSSTTSQLYAPLVCQADNDGAVLIVDRGNHRVLVRSAAGAWRDVTPEPRLSRPFSAVWWRNRLYVLHLEDKDKQDWRITLFA